MIPKNIHLIFLRKDEPFPELFEKCKQEIQVNHPDWNIRLYNKDDAQDILNQDLPEYIEAYNAFYHNVQKADFLRLALVYLYGGFYMFGGIPKHPFLHRIMDEMAERATIILKSQQEILDITGPGLLTDTYWDNYGMYTDITLLRNTDKRCRQPYHNEISCHFGDYAAHLHAGTWRTGI